MLKPSHHKIQKNNIISVLTARHSSRTPLSYRLAAASWVTFPCDHDFVIMISTYKIKIGNHIYSSGMIDCNFLNYSIERIVLASQVIISKGT